MDFQEVMDRIEDILERDNGEKVFAKDIAEAIGMSPSQYSNAKTRNSIPYEKISEFCARKRININWVLYGQSIEMLNSDTEEIYKIKLYSNISGSAGGGAFNEDNEDYTYLAVDKTYIEMLGVSNKKYIESIRVEGDSMEDTIRDNAIVVLDRSKTDIVNGGIYVVNTTGGTFIKRLTISSSGGINLISDNKNYPIETLSFDEVSVVGKVIGALERI